MATVDLKYKSSGASIQDTTCFLPVRATRPIRFLLPFNKFTGDGTAGSAMTAGVCGGATTGSRWTLFDGGPTCGTVTPRRHNKWHSKYRRLEPYSTLASLQSTFKKNFVFIISRNFELALAKTAEFKRTQLNLVVTTFKFSPSIWFWNNLINHSHNLILFNKTHELIRTSTPKTRSYIYSLLIWIWDTARFFLNLNDTIKPFRTQHEQNFYDILVVICACFFSMNFFKWRAVEISLSYLRY